MFTNYFKTAIRGFLRQKTYSLINIAGLSVGLASSIMILLWVSDELAVNQFHEDADRIYMVHRNYHATDIIHTWQSITKPAAAYIDANVPEIENTVIVTWTQWSTFTRPNGDPFYEEGFYVSNDFLEVFSYPLIQGNRETALDGPDAIAISDRVAERLYGTDWRTQNIVGRTILIDNRKDFVVRGVFEHPGNESSLKFGYLANFDDFYQRNKWLDHWGNSSARLFVRLRQDADPLSVNESIRTILTDNHTSSNQFMWIQPFRDAYLHSQFENGVITGGRIEYVRIFTVVAVFILVIAAMNYTNLATARSTLRTREIGVRKAVGAGKRTLIAQFMGESVLLTLIAGLFAASLIQFALPYFNTLTQKSLELDLSNLRMIATFVGVCLLTGVIGGMYPALYLSGFDPVRVLRGTYKHRPGAGRLRQGLIVFQFGWSVMLIIGTLTVYDQLNYIWTKNLGLERENLLHAPLHGQAKENYDAFKAELLKSSAFVSVTRSNQDPLSVGNSTSDPNWEGKDPEAIHEISIIKADFDYVQTMKFNLLDGRSFDPDRDVPGSDENMSFLINETMSRVMGTDDPVGKQIRFWGQTGTVVGLLQDFHQTSMHREIGPLIIRLDAPKWTTRFDARVAPGQEKEAVAVLTRLYKQFNPEYPLNYRFVSEDFDRMYSNEAVLSKLATTFAVLAGFISCLGLLGLASFASVQRTREIGIRKTLGAGIGHLIGLLSRDFVILVVIAFAISAPIAHHALNTWLNDFAYRVEIDWPTYVIGGLLALSIAWLTVSSQALRAARTNPTETLRTE